jgi:hypothetical protein
MHSLRRNVLMRAVDALIAGRRLTMMDMARSWPGAERVRAPLKALDRLLGNRHLYEERMRIYGSMACWLMGREHPIIVVDWSDLKADRSWHLLRAAVPVGGRTLTLLDMVFPAGQQASARAESRFLQQLRTLLPPGCCPILVTDAGFRAPWFRAVTAMGWRWVGRMRNTTRVKPVDIADEPSEWLPCKALYALALKEPRDLGLMHTVESNPWVSRLIVHEKPARGRKDRNRFGGTARNSNSRKSAQREREPWLLATSPDLKDLTARQLVAIYAQRMQIESSFRDLKSHRYGQGFEDSLTRKGPRIEILLLLNALAAFASWVVGLGCEATGAAHWLSPNRSPRRQYSIVRIGREALVRRWPFGVLSDVLERIRQSNRSAWDQTAGVI